MLASVVVITYNSSKTVIETLDSIYNQTYKELELVITDDCSKDDTIAIIKRWIEEYGKRFVRCELIANQKNNGTSRNANIGIFACNGEYVQLIAGDDLLLPKLMEVKVKTAVDNNLDYVVSRTIPFGEDEKGVSFFKDFCSNGYEIIKKGYKSQYNKILEYNYLVGPSGGFYKRSFFVDFGGYDEGFPLLEDYPFIFRYLKSGREIYLIDQELTKYRVSANSVCNGPSSSFWKNMKDFFFKERLKELFLNGDYWWILKWFVKIFIRDIELFWGKLKRGNK